MKKLSLVLVVLTIGLVLSLGGCTCSSSVDDAGLKITPAPIHVITINIADSTPPQVSVSIKAGLPDGCTTFHETIVERDGNTITISIMVERPKNTLCAEIYEYFDEDVYLGVDFVSGETYIVKVNDKTEYFVMP